MKIDHEISRRAFLALAGGAALLPSLAWPVSEVPTLLDHFILGCADLDRGIDFVEQHTGVRAAFGGVHPGRGTRNALLSLGERRYLEVMAPDPAQGVTPQISRLPELKEPRIVGWAAHPGNLQVFAERLRKASIAFTGPRAGSRQRPDGRILKWESLTLQNDHGGLLPFFIEWSADSVHPSVDAPKGCMLRRFEAVTPETEDLLHAASLLGLDLYAGVSKEPALKATIDGPKGELAVTS
jgi:hypothetical protein